VPNCLAIVGLQRIERACGYQQIGHLCLVALDMQEHFARGLPAPVSSHAGGRVKHCGCPEMRSA
jgi:hypothetical protein